MPMKSVLFSTSVANFSRSASARLRPVMSVPVSARKRIRPASSLIGRMTRSTSRWLPSATKYGSSARNVRPALASSYPDLIRSTSVADGVHHGPSHRRVPDCLRLRVAAALPGEPVHLDGRAVEIHDSREQRTLLEERAELGIRSGRFRQQAPLALLALALARYIARDLGCADDIAGFVPDGRDRERNEDAAAVAAHPLGLVVVDALARLEARDDPVFLLESILGDDERDVATHGLLRGVAEQPLRRGVPALDHAIERLADDGVVGGFDDRRQQAGSAQAARGVRLPVSPFGDVPKDEDAPRDRAPFILYRCRTVVDRTLDAILADEDRMIGDPYDGVVAQCPCRWILERLPGPRVDDPEDLVERFMQRIRLRPPGQGLGNGIHIRDAAFVVGGDDGVADAAQRHPHQLAALARAQPGSAHRFADPDDQCARECVRDSADDQLGVDRAERAAGLDEKVIAGEEANDGERGSPDDSRPPKRRRRRRRRASPAAANLPISGSSSQRRSTAATRAAIAVAKAVNGRTRPR